jgi:hypothetical protein
MICKPANICRYYQQWISLSLQYDQQRVATISPWRFPWHATTHCNEMCRLKPSDPSTMTSFKMTKAALALLYGHARK